MFTQLRVIRKVCQRTLKELQKFCDFSKIIHSYYIDLYFQIKIEFTIVFRISNYQIWQVPEIVQNMVHVYIILKKIELRL